MSANVFARSKLIRFLFLLLVLIVGLWARFYRLGEIPNGIAPDEADMGYNAYSIMQTGEDVYGRSFPLFPQALDDYKPGFVLYGAIPAIYLFGLNDFSIRLTPAILGSFIPLFIFLLVKLLYPKNAELAFIVALLTLLSPWGIQISRAMAWYSEMIFFYLLFLILFLYAIKNNSRVILLSAIFLSITPYIYHASFIYIPLTILILTLIYKKEIIKNLKLFLLFLLLIFALLTPAIINYRNQLGRARFNAISVLNPDITLTTSISEINYDLKNNFPFSFLIHNRRLVFINTLAENYVSYFNFDYLFINARNVRYFYVNNVGLYYLLELPLFLVGLYGLARRRAKSDLLILSLLIIAPLPATITLGKAFIHRGLLLLPLIQIITAIGAISTIDKLSKSSRVAYFSILITYLLGTVFFLHQYFIHSPNEFTSEKDNGAWFSTVKEIIPIINDKSQNYDKVIFTWSQAKLVPPIYFLFYNRIDPRTIQDISARWDNEPPSYKQIYNKIGNIEFRRIDWKEDQKLKNVLFVGYPEEFPKDVQNILAKTYLPNGEVHFLLVENR